MSDDEIVLTRGQAEIALAMFSETARSEEEDAAYNAIRAQLKPKRAEHTPGRWLIVNTFMVYVEEEDGRLRCVADCAAGSLDRAEQIANAHLVAQAPAMLSLLSDMSARWDALASTLDGTLYAYGYDDIQEAKAIVAKAKGEE